MSQSATSTMIWSEQDMDDRSTLFVSQHREKNSYRSQYAPPPFEISHKARRILGLGVDGFHVNVPALRLTAASPESFIWRDSSTGLRLVEGERQREERKRRERIMRFERHLAEGPRQSKYVEKGWQGRTDGGTEERTEEGTDGTEDETEDETEERFEFPARQEQNQEERGKSVNAPITLNLLSPSQRYYAQPRTVESSRQGRVSLDSLPLPSQSEWSKQGRSSLDLPREKSFPKTEQRSLRPVNAAVHSKQGRTSPELRTSPMAEQRMPRPIPVAVHSLQERTSLDSLRPKVSIKIEQRSTRSVSLSTHKTGPGPKTGEESSPLLSVSRRGKSNSFPNFSRPLSQVEPRKVPREDIGDRKMSMEKIGVQEGEMLRPSMVGIADGELQQERSRYQESAIAGSGKDEHDASLSWQSKINEPIVQQDDTPLSPQTGLVGGTTQTPSRLNTGSLFENTSMNVFPGDEESTKLRSKPLLSKILISLPLCLLRTGNRRITKARAQRSRVGRGGTYNRHLTEENLRQLEEHVGVVPKIYALDLSLLPTPPILPEDTNDRLVLPPSLPLQVPATPPTSQHSGKSPSATDSACATRILPSLPDKTPPSSPLQDQQIAKPELPERMRISRVKQTCTVCKETRHIAHFSTWCPTTKCVHPSRTCVECMQRWIATCVETKGWDSCVCPECGQALAYDDVKLFATQDVFDRYDHLSTRAVLSSLSNFHWCQSPTCSSGHIYDNLSVDNPIFTCPSCHHMHCFNHPSVPYHAGETCSQYNARITLPSPATPSAQKKLKQREMEERANIKTVQETSKRCPNAMCGWFIEKNEGCDRMTCWKCRFEFCWECCAAWGPIEKRGNRFHKQGCKYRI